MVGLLALGLGLALYANTLGHQYCLDDFSAIKENWVVKGGLKNLGTIFTTEYRFGAWNSPGSLYRPLTLAMFAFEWQLSPDKPFLGHLMNVLFYALSGWMLWITWRRIFSAYTPALPALAVLLFMAHPVHTEVVANIKSRDEIMALLCCTMALYGIWRYVERSSAFWLGFSVLIYGVGLFFKESALTFLAVFPLTLWYFSNKSLAENLRISAPFLLPALFFWAVRENVIGAQPYQEVYSILDNFMVDAPPASRLASAFMMCGYYLKAIVVPVSLVSDMGYPQMKAVDFGDGRAISSLLLYLGMFVWALIQMKKKHFLSFAILFYLIPFSLFSNVLAFLSEKLMIGTSYGERLLYAPSLGFAFALAWVILKIAGQTSPASEGQTPTPSIWNPGGKGALVWGLAAVVLALYGAKTVSRNMAWYDSDSLYAADVPQSPNCAKLNYHYALEITKKGLDEKAGTVKDKSWVEKGVQQYTKAIELYPQYHDAYGSRGLAHFRLQQYDQAFNDYQKSLKYRPNDSKVLSNMGFIYFIRQQLDSAEVVYRRSIRYDPRFVDARRNLGAVLAMKKQFPQAIEQWTEALKYDPNNATLHFYIGSAYRDSGQPDKAQPWLDKARQLDPNLK